MKRKRRGKRWGGKRERKRKSSMSLCLYASRSRANKKAPASVDWHYVTLRNHCQKAGRRIRQFKRCQSDIQRESGVRFPVEESVLGGSELFWESNPSTVFKAR
ncbi:hypothetical protein EYF80_045549 [Liparis tanakae]|uniref:Uncharacterized protein n=1 Tax=Liparis tanakae TaxID=230148 RepID=A0A4Z2FST3_9TELE|nr:hypothetical protein EYF80_045549 [Liparis tanakae]